MPVPAGLWSRLCSTNVYLMILARTILEEFHQKTSEAAFSTVFLYDARRIAVHNVGMVVHIKFGDSRSNGFHDIRGAPFVSDERTNIGEACPNSAKRKAFLLKKINNRKIMPGPNTMTLYNRMLFV